MLLILARNRKASDTTKPSYIKLNILRGFKGGKKDHFPIIYREN